VESRNPELFRVNGDVDTTVTVEISMPRNMTDEEVILNVIEYLQMWRNTRPHVHKSWGKRIAISRPLRPVRSRKQVDSDR
jgi:hypothetical protein